MCLNAGMMCNDNMHHICVFPKHHTEVLIFHL